MNRETLKKIIKITEDFYGTESDPNQIPVTEESSDKLLSINTDTVLYRTDKNQNPVACVVVIPTSKKTMKKFLNKEITEKELLDIAVSEKKGEALYLCSAFVVPEFRRKGYAIRLLLEAIEKLSNKQQKIPLYYWGYSKEGKGLAQNLSKIVGRDLLALKN